MEEKDNLQLPENAFRELKDGEEYKPLMSPDKVYPEVNGWSVTWGIMMAVIFSAAAAYLGLKVGQVKMSSSRASEPVRVLWWQEPYLPCQPSTSCRLNIRR